jgi:hypothetical protein
MSFPIPGVITAGLLMGEGDFARTLCITLMGGHDRIVPVQPLVLIMGILFGAQSFTAEWIEPLNDQVVSVIKGFAQSVFMIWRKERWPLCRDLQGK